MHCPSCGTEVTDQAVYCHKCGERLDRVDQQLPAVEPGENDSAAERVAEEAAVQPARTPLERLQEDAAARQASEDQPEQELWAGGYCSKAMLGAWVASGLITVLLLALTVWAWHRYVTLGAFLAIVILWLFQLLRLVYRRLHVRYRLTTQRLLHEAGILRRVTDRIETIDMDDVTWEQTFLERLVGVGTIRVTSSDRTHPELVLVGIENVKEVAEKIDDVRRNERRRRGLHIESV